MAQSRPNPTALVCRVTIRRFSDTLRILNLRILTARIFTNGERSCIVRSKGKRCDFSDLVANLFCTSYRHVIFQFWNHGNLAYLGSRNGTCAEIALEALPKPGELHRGRSLISIVVNCCQISIVPRTRPKRSLHCTYLLYFPLGQHYHNIAILPYSFPWQRDANEKKKLSIELTLHTLM